jgi:hypothetical protein
MRQPRSWLDLLLITKNKIWKTPPRLSTLQLYTCSYGKQAIKDSDQGSVFSYRVCLMAEGLRIQQWNPAYFLRSFFGFVPVAQSREGSSNREVRRQLPIPNRASWPREARAGKCEVLKEPNPTMVVRDVMITALPVSFTACPTSFLSLYR